MSLTPAKNGKSTLRKICVNIIPVFLILTALALSLSCRPEPTAPQEASVIIIEPQTGATLSTNTVTIKTFVENFELINKVGQNNSQTEGHIIYYKDVTPPLMQGKEALTGPDTYVISAESSHIWQDVPPGQHTFWVQLVNNDNTSLQPPAAVRTIVTIASE
jgi:hypothetical protein